MKPGAVDCPSDKPDHEVSKYIDKMIYIVVLTMVFL